RGGGPAGPGPLAGAPAVRPGRGGGDRGGAGPPRRHAVGEPDVRRHGDRVLHPGAAPGAVGRLAPGTAAPDTPGGLGDGIPAATPFRGRPGGVARAGRPVVGRAGGTAAPRAFGGAVPAGTG